MKEYLYDGTFEGLLTAIYYSYSIRENVIINKVSAYTPNLLGQPETIKTEEDKFHRVYSSIEEKLSSSTLKNVYHLYLSDIPAVETLIFRYIKLCYKYGDNINLAKNNDIILLVDKYVRKVTLESHRFTGFVRFKEIAPFSYYATIEPDHNILPIIAPHFATRFSDQSFIIHDIKRETAILYNKSDLVIAPLSKEVSENLKISALRDNFENLWKEFYKSVNIEERKNLILQRRSMPKRYWKHLIETE